MTIKRKFLLHGVVMFVALGTICLVAGMIIRDARRDQVHDSIEAIANLERVRLEDLLGSQQANLTAQLAAAGVADELAGVAPADRLAVELDLVVERSSGLSAAALVDRDGAMLASAAPSDGTAVVAGSDHLAAAISAIELGAAYAVGPANRVGPDDERYPLIVPVRDSSEQIGGYLVAEFDLEPIERLFGQQEVLGRTAEVYLVQAIEAGAQFVTDPRFAPESRFELIPGNVAGSPAILAIDGPAATYDGVRDYRGEQVIASVRHVAGTPFAIVVKMDESEAYAAFDRAISIGLIGFTLAAMFSLGALALASSSVLRRIRRVSDSAASISAGELTARVGDRSPDELGVLARAFDQMADTLVADMAQRQEIEAELAHRARHDALTGLPNRLAFQHTLKDALTEQWKIGSVAVLFCDLDEFKTVNDDLGHSVGDALLREVTARLRRAVPPQHTLARFGGDEFVVVARGLGSPDEAVAIAERICAELSAAISLGGRDVFVTTSVGVAISKLASTAETLVRDADAAMYQAKGLGRARVVIHDDSIGPRSNNRLTLSTELHRAIANGGLTIALQPIADLRTGEVHAMEALVRWNHEGREIDPSMFVMRATELDLAGALDRWVLAEACRLMARLRGMASAEVGWLHVNVTGTSLVDETFADDVIAHLAAHKITPSELCLEIVEDRLGGAPQIALATLDRLRTAGVRVAIDDFGTGHSSLARLRDLPADTVKIDQAFIRDLTSDPTSLAITGSVISLADRLGLEVVAEGVEHFDQARLLLDLGCHYGQGYLIGVPRRSTAVLEDHSVLDPATTTEWPQLRSRA